MDFHTTVINVVLDCHSKCHTWHNDSVIQQNNLFQKTFRPILDFKVTKAMWITITTFFGIEKCYSVLIQKI